MIHSCPRCELRFRSASEVKEHLAVDHDAPEQSFEPFQYRSSRSVPPLYPQHHRQPRTAARNYLIVANQTLGGGELTAHVQQLAAEGPATFHVVVPATHTADYVTTHTRAEREIRDSGGGGDVDEGGQAQARWRLREAVERLRAAGVEVQGEVGLPDPFHAVERASREGDYDAVILSTLPSGLSRWLDADLPRRIERRLGLPVMTVTAQR